MVNFEAKLHLIEPFQKAAHGEVISLWHLNDKALDSDNWLL